MTYHRRIKELRKRRRMSQEKLGELVGMRQYTISKIENQKSGVSTEKLSEIATALGVSMAGFWRGTESVQ